MYSLYIMGALYIVLGILHFTHTGFYRPLMPTFLPAHNFLIYLSGIAEVLLGLGVFFPKIRSLALWGIIAMLIVFLLLPVLHSTLVRYVVVIFRNQVVISVRTYIR